MPKSRIIHLSDLHFTKNPKNQNPPLTLPIGGTSYQLDVHSETIANALWKEAVRLLGEVESSLLAVSGDLTSTGEKSQFEVVLTYLLSHFRWGYNPRERFGVSRDNESPLQTRDDEGAPYLLTPGNHDAWGGGLNILSLSTQTRFVRNYMKIRMAYFPPSSPAVRILRGNSPPLLVFGLDSALPKPWNLARGKVEEGQLRRVYDRSELEERNLGQPPLKIAVMHHAVSSAHSPAGLTALENRPDVERWLKAAGINMVLSGHLHRDYLDPPPSPLFTPPLAYSPFSLGQRILYSGVGTATALPATSSLVNSFKVYDYEDTTVVIRSFQFRTFRFIETTPSPPSSYSLTPSPVGQKPSP